MSRYFAKAAFLGFSSFSSFLALGLTTGLEKSWSNSSSSRFASSSSFHSTGVGSTPPPPLPPTGEEAAARVGLAEAAAGEGTSNRLLLGGTRMLQGRNNSKSY